MITPEQQLRNVATLILEQTEVTRQWNGRGRGPTYAATVGEIAPTARQLAEMITQYLNGTLEPSDDTLPF